MEILVGNSSGFPKGLMADLSRYRHRVFVEKLGWPLKSENGHELDQFDRPDTLYVVGRNEIGEVIASARLLPTTKPYLLAGVFPQLLNGLPPPNSAEVWELSRFAAVDFNSPTGSPLKQFSSPVSVELLRACMACAAERGAKRLITVSPIGVERLLQWLGIRSHRAGPPMIVDGQELFACWISL